jgi:hypothetical protein
MIIIVDNHKRCCYGSPEAGDAEALPYFGAYGCSNRNHTRGQQLPPKSELLLFKFGGSTLTGI